MRCSSQSQSKEWTGQCVHIGISQCKRETHHTSSPFQLSLQVPPNTKKTVLDAVDGYHSIPLDEESQPLTTFITEWGRFMYLRMLQGYVASGDAYTRRYNEIIKDIPRKIKVVDDTLLYDKTIKDAFYHTLDYLSLLLLLHVVAFYIYIIKFKL